MEDKISYKAFVSEFIVLALPVAFQQLITNLLNMIDNLMVGALAEECISAVSVCNTFIWLTTTFAMASTAGAVVISAQAYGAGNKEKIKRIFSLTLTLNVIVSLIFFVLMWFFPRQIMALYTNDLAVIEQGSAYLSIIKYDLIFSAISITIISSLQAVRNVKFGFYNSLLSCLVNVFFNWALIFGNLGFSALGIKGAAIATLIARIVEAVISVFYLFNVEDVLLFEIKDFNPYLNKEELAKLFQITLPILIMNISSNLVSSMQTMITGHVSEYYIAANAVVHTAWTLPNVACSGLSTASGIMIGNQLGKNNIVLAQNYAKKFILAALVMGFINSGLLLLLLPVITPFYNISLETIALVNKMGRFAAITIIFISISNILCFGVVKSRGNTLQILKLEIIVNWFIAIPLGLIAAFVFKFPPEYLYIILRLGTLLTGIWALYQVATGKWLKNS